MKNILLISYTFPPYPGIGGRRWAKFAKYLAKSGYTIHVVCAKNPYKHTSFHTNDVSSERIKLHTFRSHFPIILQNIHPKTLFEKIKYKFWMKFLQFFAKGFVYDKAILDEKKIVSLAKKVIKENNIKNVITTGGPFRLNYYSLELKKDFNEIYLINDFRDPWIWGNQYSKLNTEQRFFELNMQNQVMQQSDLITVPVEPMRKHLAEKYPDYAGKIYLLPHAFDEDEIVVKNEYRKDGFRCVLFGSMYSGIESYFDALCKVIAELNGKLTLDIFPDIEKYKDIVKKNGAKDWVKYNKPLTGKLLFETLSHYDYVVFIYPSYVKDFISTKFYEIISSKIPIIYIGEDGVASNFICSNNLGIHVTESTIDSKLKDFINGRLNWNYNHNYNVEEYSFYNVSNKVSNFFV